MDALQQVNYAETQYQNHLSQLAVKSDENTKVQIGVMAGTKVPNYNIAPAPTPLETLTTGVETATGTSLLDAIA